MAYFFLGHPVNIVVGIINASGALKITTVYSLYETTNELLIFQFERIFMFSFGIVKLQRQLVAPERI